jgi:hypothetical protein
LGPELAAEVVGQLMTYAGQDKAHLRTSEPCPTHRRDAPAIEDLMTDLRNVLGNATQFRQIVMNLVINRPRRLATAAVL